MDSTAAGAPTWLPIDTAPKDGRGVLLCWAIDADGKPIDWNEEPSSSGVFVQLASWWEGEGDDGDGEWMVYCSLPQEPELHFVPTHWMPLPSPPEREVSK